MTCLLNVWENIHPDADADACRTYTIDNNQFGETAYTNKMYTSINHSGSLELAELSIGQ